MALEALAIALSTCTSTWHFDRKNDLPPGFSVTNKTEHCLEHQHRPTTANRSGARRFTSVSTHLTQSTLCPHPYENARYALRLLHHLLPPTCLGLAGSSLLRLRARPGPRA